MLHLVLWDIDHTLIENAGVSKQIYAAAFELLTGHRAVHQARTNGRTDQEIMAHMLEEHGAVAADWPATAQALQRAGALHRQTLAVRGSVLPGVVELITALAQHEGLVQTVVTGNVRANAEIKLDALGLTRAFDLDVGGYGSDHIDRFRLVEKARGRAAAKYGSEYGSAGCAVVIGDTPRDIEAAQRSGIRILAVASGLYGADELRAAGGQLVVPDLTDTADVLEHLALN